MEEVLSKSEHDGKANVNNWKLYDANQYIWSCDGPHLPIYTRITGGYPGKTQEDIMFISFRAPGE